MKRQHTIPVMLLMLLCSVSLQAGLPPEYSAVYNLHKFGMHAAQASSSLQRQADGSWLYRSQTETRGLVAVFRKDRIIEQTVLQEYAGGFRPLDYQYIHEGSNKNRNHSVSFDWDNMIGNATTSGSPQTITIKPDTIDSFSLQLKLMHDLQNGKRTLVYPVIRKGKLTDYRFDILGHEMISTGAGDFDTIKLQRSREHSKRRTIMWAAPELHYLPVKIQHVETDGSEFSLLLESVNGKITEHSTSDELSASSD